MFMIMKTLRIIGFISLIPAAFLIIAGLLDKAFHITAGFMGISAPINYFIAANTFLLIALCCLLYKPLKKRSPLP
jgi:hypothetical protein